MRLLDMFLEGGTIMYLILLCSIVMVCVSVERLLVLRKARTDVGQFMMKVRALFQKGDVDPVLAYCSQRVSFIANIIRRGALKHDLGIDRVRDAIEDATNEETYRLEKRLPILGSIARIAPLLGLLGTVVGLMNTVQWNDPIGRTQGSGNVTPSLSTALTAIGLGLAVGILAFAMSSYLNARVARIDHEMRTAKTEFLDLLMRAAPIEKPLPVQNEEHLNSYSIKPATATLVFEDDLYFRKKK